LKQYTPLDRKVKDIGTDPLDLFQKREIITKNLFLYLTKPLFVMKVPSLIPIPREETQNLTPDQALQYAAQKVLEGGHEGAELFCTDLRKSFSGDPQMVKKNIVNLGVFKGMRPENQRIHSAVPGAPKIYILKS
jgi:hypothetical protein